MRYLSDAQWNTLLRILVQSHGELICRKCKKCELLVQAMFCGTLDLQRKFAFEDLDDTQIDMRTEFILSLVESELG